MSTQTSTSHDRLVRGLQAGAVLTVLNVAWQFVTAGQILPSGGPAGLHAGGAIGLHLFSGVSAVMAFLLWRRSVVPAALVGLAAVVFVLTIIQAALGGYDTLWIHVPGAMVVTVGAVWVAVWALTGVKGPAV